VHDPWGDVLTGFSGVVTLTGVGFPVLATDTLVGGVAEFRGVRVNFEASGLRLRARVTGETTPAESAEFEIMP
jgi:hypothetical protein